MSENENNEMIIQEFSDSGVLRLTLNDNGRRNALSEAMLGNLGKIMRSSATDANVRVIVLAANGPAFCAGHDLKEMTAGRNAADTAKFSTPGVHIGLFCSTPMVALSRSVSNKHAMEMLLTGDMVSPERAVEIGLINQVTNQDSLKSFTMEIAEKIASKSSMTLATGKKAFYEQKELNLEDAYAYASQVMVDNMLKHDAEEGINAFIEKRKANWLDK